MARETARTKAHRLLAEGRLMVTRVDPHGIVQARARGEGRVYALGFEFGEWRCSCPHKGPGCSHLVALRSVVAVEGDLR